MSDTYKQDGVDRLAGGNLSEYIGKIRQNTWNQPFAIVSLETAGYSSAIRLTVKGDLLRKGCYLTEGSDGIGTKTAIIVAERSFQDAAKDLLTMLADDITRSGGLPLWVNTVLDVSTTSYAPPIQELFKGIVEYADKLRIAVANGELAELGDFVGPIEIGVFRFLWSGSMTGLMHPNLRITGETVRAGDSVIALREYGFRSNGISSVRKGLASQFGDEWWHNPVAESAIRRASEPSVSYSRFLSKINGWSPERCMYGTFRPDIPVGFIAHLSGGSIVEKLGEKFLARAGLSAVLNDLWDPPSIMREAAEWRELPDEEIYSTWNGGQGTLLIVAPEHARRVIATACHFGIQAKQCGNVVSDSEPTLSVRSKFSGGIIEYSLTA